ncbi:diadenosine tetraphosphate (Ap4A) HIT family hydrolase [Friedmanniella endophytica]|uniref:Diadenosine tetraphosphate (Ap4A) HIT family hydrolase n=1 Tax=Microlunatus kandeliicorticis TaxID=1759536 RepID=A0A7W3P5H0_9ACTN|nr:hypothetical protein [Microlunatus kandeliicorticis]MBA8793966.1 diadenosine tetraphosphate (Ap4A) HIT family hydrolase [Microlunatus kandeliicorticis]
MTTDHCERLFYRDAWNRNGRICGVDVPGCLGCDLIQGRRDLPGGFIFRSDTWVINHVVGSMNLGTLVLSPTEHIDALADLSQDASLELGLLLRRSALTVEQILQPEQTYVALWAHGSDGRKHLHIVVQPVTAETVREYGGARSEQLQALMLEGGVVADRADIVDFCETARAVFARV